MTSTMLIYDVPYGEEHYKPPKELSKTFRHQKELQDIMAAQTIHMVLDIGSIHVVV